MRHRVDCELRQTSLEVFQDVKRRLAKVVLLFQDKFVDLRVDSGSLVQVWLPETADDGRMLLYTKGLPFCVAGAGDLLALFRCISCRYKFGTNIAESKLLGAPGRVFSTGEAEMSRNVQQYSKDIYLRATEAQQCQIQSTIVLPLFDSPARNHTVGVLEVVQTAADMPFACVISTLNTILQGCQLWTCKPDDGPSREMSQSSDTVKAIADRTRGSPQTSGEVSVTLEDKATEDICSSGGSAKLQAALPEQGSAVATSLTAALPPTVALSLPVAPIAHHSGVSPLSSAASVGPRTEHRPPKIEPALLPTQADMAAEEPGDEGSDGEGMDDGIMMDDDEDAAAPAGARRGKGTGNPGKPGKRLRLADLQGQFGVGLKEAANRLGICPTTLKRACRRHGIQRWPRRQLLKLSRAIDQINATTNLADEQDDMLGAVPAPAAQKDAEAAASSSSDGRWSHLAQLIPGLQAQLREPPPVLQEPAAPLPALTGNVHAQEPQPAQPPVLYSSPLEASSMPGVDRLQLGNQLDDRPLDALTDSASLFASQFQSHAPPAPTGSAGGQLPHLQPSCGQQAMQYRHMPLPASMELPVQGHMHPQLLQQVPLSAQMPSSSFEWPDDLLGPFGQHLNGHDFPQQGDVRLPRLSHQPNGYYHGQSYSYHNHGVKDTSGPGMGRHGDSGDSMADDLQDDVGIVDQSVLDLLLEVPA